MNLDRRGRCNVLSLTKPDDESIPVRFCTSFSIYIRKKGFLCLARKPGNPSASFGGNSLSIFPVSMEHKSVNFCYNSITGNGI